MTVSDRGPAKRTELFADDRGSVLRATWHPSQSAVVVSCWRDGTCVGTVRLSSDDVSRLSTFLVEAWVAAVRQEVSEGAGAAGHTDVSGQLPATRNSGSGC